MDGCNYEESNDSSCMDRIDGLDEEEEEEEDETDNTMVEISNQSSNMNPASQLSGENLFLFLSSEFLQLMFS